MSETGIVCQLSQLDPPAAEWEGLERAKAIACKYRHKVIRIQFTRVKYRACHGLSI